MNSNWVLLIFLALGSILYVIGNEQLLTLTKYDPTQSPKTQQMTNLETLAQSLEARVYWIMQLGGLTLGVISLLELYVKNKDL